MNPADLIVDRADVQPHLPQGFSASFAGSENLAEVVLSVYVCDGFILNNETILQQARFALTMAKVDVNKTLRENSTFRWYVFEAFADQQPLVDFLALRGLPVTLAEIGLERPTPHVSLSVAKDGILWYKGSGSYAPGDPLSEEMISRWFYSRPNQSIAWVDYHEYRQHDGKPEAITLTVNQGFLKNVKPGDSAAFLGATQDLTSTGILVFPFG